MAHVDVRKGFKGQYMCAHYFDIQGTKTSI